MRGSTGKIKLQYLSLLESFLFFSLCLITLAHPLSLSLSLSRSHKHKQTFAGAYTHTHTHTHTPAHSHTITAACEGAAPLLPSTGRRWNTPWIDYNTVMRAAAWWMTAASWAIIVISCIQGGKKLLRYFWERDQHDISHMTCHLFSCSCKHIWKMRSLVSVVSMCSML